MVTTRRATLMPSARSKSGDRSTAASSGYASSSYASSSYAPSTYASSGTGRVTRSAAARYRTSFVSRVKSALPTLLFVLQFPLAVATIYLTYRQMSRCAWVVAGVPKNGADRVPFALRWLGLQGVVLAWQVLSVGMVRGSNPGLRDPLAPRSRYSGTVYFEAWRNVLANTVEQTLASAALQLSVVGFLPQACLVAIPAVNVLFVAGRLAFTGAYLVERTRPRMRAFGFALSFLPTLAMAAYVVYAFVALGPAFKA